MSDAPRVYSAWLPVETLGQRIHRLRTELGWALSDLSRESGIAKGQLSQIENDQADMRISTLMAIAKALDISPCVLITGGK